MFQPDDSDKAIVTQLYGQIPETVDQLPYSNSFEWMYEQYCTSAARSLDRNEFWRVLANMRKRSELPRKAR